VQIRKAAVIGSGTMGGGIASLIAGVGLPTVLLDVATAETQPGDPPAERNALVHANLERLRKARPPQLFSESVLGQLTIGNLEDDRQLLRDVDLIIEVVIEDLEIKHQVFRSIIPFVGEKAILTTNTSGLPIHEIARVMPEPIARRFIGTHFFNPARYLHLLEVIPHGQTDEAVIRTVADFGRDILGKGVVICKDRPNFIGNRFMSMVGQQGMNLMLDQGLTIEEVDYLTGPLIGRPKTASFHLLDLVGFDVHVFVARNLHPAIADDPARDVLVHAKAEELSEAMVERQWLGRKTGRGFYHMRRVNGKREFWALDWASLEHRPPKNVRMDRVEALKKILPLGERLRRLIAVEDPAGRYLWHLFAFYLSYASQRVPEIADQILPVDQAIRWGFGHELGPFEMWDALGVRETVAPFEAAGYPVADWVKQMLADGVENFYRRDPNGFPSGFYAQDAGRYLPVPKDAKALNLTEYRAHTAPIAQNDGAAIHDLGDRVLLLEFTSKENAIVPATLEQSWRALELLDSARYDALVIGNQGQRFSVGFQLQLGLEMVAAGQWSELEKGIASAQQLVETMRHFHKPVIVAPFQHTLGGGAEIMMGGTAIVAAMELYTGLVEMSVGLIPSGGGCVQMLRRLLNPVMMNAKADPMPHLEQIFETIARAKVSGSALEARELGFLSDRDLIVVNQAHLIQRAKRKALSFCEGFQPHSFREVWAAGRDAHSTLLIAIDHIRRSGFASEYDAHIAAQLAYVLCGGDLAQPGWLAPEYFYTLEREAFLRLMGEEKTRERILHMLKTNQPLRN